MLCNADAWVSGLQNILPTKTYNAAKTLTLTAGVAGLGVVMVLLTGYVMASPTFGWTGQEKVSDLCDGILEDS